MKVVASAEMRAIEEAAFRQGETVATLMERAGKAVADAVEAAAPAGSVVVLVGPGNNGGDGLVAAERLRVGGRDVTALLWHRSDPSPFTGDTVQLAGSDALSQLSRHVSSAGMVVDALLGTGASRPPDGDLADILRAVDQSATAERFTLAVDVPTGVNADTGAVPGEVFRADLTICLGLAKVGVVSYPGAEFAGDVLVADIGLPQHLSSNVMTSVPEEPEIRRILPNRDAVSNKGSSGRLLAISGSRNFSGAPVMCSMAAYRTGAGLVEIATPESTHPLVAAHVVEPVFLPLPESGGSVTADALPVVRAALGKSKACVAGPGLGLTSHTVEFMRGLVPMLAEHAVPAVLDADALNALSRIDGWYRHAGRVAITPHPGEMSRLTGLSIDEIQADRLGVARRHAASWGVVVVLKGAGTVVAAPDGRVSINPTGGPNLATAGTGDVLSGIISGLLAQGLSLYNAAVCGVYLHGRAGDLLRDEWGNVGTIAGDLIDVLPDARIAILQESEVDG